MRKEIKLRLFCSQSTQYVLILWLLLLLHLIWYVMNSRRPNVPYCHGSTITCTITIMLLTHLVTVYRSCPKDKARTPKVSVRIHVLSLLSNHLT